MQKQRVRPWNGAILSCSTKASNSFTQNARQIETGRSAKHEANNRLYKIQPLRQQKAIAIWPSASEHGYSIHEAKRHSLDFTLRRALWSTAFQRSLFILLVPTAILQSQGFWQHKGLEKHNTISVASSILTCNGLATQKRALLLLEVDVYLGCFNWRQRRIDCLISITLLSSLQTALLSKLFDHTRIPPQTMNSPHMLLTRKLCWLIVMTLSNEKKRRNHEAKRTFFNSSMSVAAPMTLNAFPEKLKPPAPSCVNSHTNSNTTVQVYATCMCLPKNKAKENGHCQKTCEGFWQLFGKGRLFGRPFFKTNPQELSTMCIYPENSWTKQRRCQ